MDRPVHRDAPVGACPLDDGNEESSSGLSYLSLVDGTLDETECLEEAPHRKDHLRPVEVSTAAVEHQANLRAVHAEPV